MSAVFLAQRRGRVPPEAVAKAAARHFGVPSVGRLWPLAHVALGITFGAAAEVLGLPRGQIGRTAYGLVLFVLDYGVIAPRLGLYPDLVDDSRNRRLVNAGSHAVFGWLLASRR
jgi:hypothetical protein